MRAEWAAALLLAAAPLRAQAPAGINAGAAAQLQAMAAVETGGSPEHLAASAARGADGVSVWIPEAVLAPGSGAVRPMPRPSAPAAGLSRPRSRPPVLRNPFPRPEDGPWVGAAEKFLTVERLPLTLIRRKGVERVVGAALAAVLLVPALIAAAVGFAIGKTW